MPCVSGSWFCHVCDEMEHALLPTWIAPLSYLSRESTIGLICRGRGRERSPIKTVLARAHPSLPVRKDVLHNPRSPSWSSAGTAEVWWVAFLFTLVLGALKGHLEAVFKTKVKARKNYEVLVVDLSC